MNSPPSAPLRRATLGRRILANFSLGLVGRAITVVSPLVLLPMFALQWGAELYGEWLLVTAVPAYIMLAPDFGIAPVASNRISILSGAGRDLEAQTLYRTTFFAIFLGTALFCLLGWAVSPLIPWTRIFSLRHLTNRDATFLVGLLCAQLMIQQLIGTVGSSYRAAEKNPRSALIGSLFGVGELASALVALHSGFGPLQFCLVILGNKGAALAFLIWDSHRISGGLKLSLGRCEFRVLRPLFAPAIGYAGMPLINALQNQGMLFVVGLTLGPATVGSFQAVRTMVNGIRSISSVVGAAVLVELPKAIGAGSIQAIGRLLKRYTQLVTFLSLVGFLGITFLGSEVFHVWTRGHFTYSSTLAIFMAIALVVQASANGLWLYLSSVNALHYVLLQNIVGMVVSLGLAFLLLPGVGIAAAGVAIFVWEILQAAFLLRCGFRVERSLPRRLYWSFLDFSVLLDELKTLFKRVVKLRT